MSSWLKYISLFFMLSAMARRIAEWYQSATSAESDGGEGITSVEWSMLLQVFTDSVAEAFNMNPDDVKYNMRNVLND